MAISTTLILNIMNQIGEQNQCDSLASSITETLGYFRKVSSEVKNAKATIEHCISLENVEVEIEVNFKVTKIPKMSKMDSSTSSNSSRTSTSSSKSSSSSKKNLTKNSNVSSVNAGLVSPQYMSTPVKKTNKDLFGSDNDVQGAAAFSPIKRPKKKAYECPKCPKRYDWEKSLNRHIAKKHPQ